MLSNPIKFKELTIPIEGYQECFLPIGGIPRCKVIIVGMTFQSNCRFNCHVKYKLIKASKCYGGPQRTCHFFFKSRDKPHLLIHTQCNQEYQIIHTCSQTLIAISASVSQDFAKSRFTVLGPAVRRLVSANPRLNFNPGFFIPLWRSLLGIIFSLPFFFFEHNIIKFFTKVRTLNFLFTP